MRQVIEECFKEKKSQNRQKLKNHGRDEFVHDAKILYNHRFHHGRDVSIMTKRQVGFELLSWS